MNVRSWLTASDSIPWEERELLAMKALTFEDRSMLVLYDDTEISPEQSVELDRLVKMRRYHVPMAYLLEEKEFYGRTFEVNAATLVPRPETEMLVELIIDADGDKVIDVGTGSGCIAITAALETTKKVVGVDISEKALRVARRNARKLEAEVEFFESDLLANYPLEGGEVIVANLPYVDRDWEWTSPEIQYEPEIALYAEDGGLKEIKRLIDFLSKVWYNKGKGGTLILEADLSQHERVKEHAKKRGFEFELKQGLGLRFLFKGGQGTLRG